MRDVAMQPGVARAIDLAHAAGAERAGNFVDAAGAGAQRHGSNEAGFDGINTRRGGLMSIWRMPRSAHRRECGETGRDRETLMVVSRCPPPCSIAAPRYPRIADVNFTRMANTWPGTPVHRVAIVKGCLALAGILALCVAVLQAGQYRAADGRLRVALVKQPFVAQRHVRRADDDGERRHSGGRSRELGATVRVNEIALTAEQEHGVRRLEAARLSRSDISAAPSRPTSATGYFTVGLLGTCPSMPGMVAGLQHSGPTTDAAQDRHALARRASRLQHAGDHAQRIARRDAGRRRDRPLPAAHAARRRPRSAARPTSTS